MMVVPHWHWLTIASICWQMVGDAKWPIIVPFAVICCDLSTNDSKCLSLLHALSLAPLCSILQQLTTNANHCQQLWNGCGTLAFSGSC